MPCITHRSNMMKTMMSNRMIKPKSTFKPLILAIALAMGITATSALAEDTMDTGNRNPVQDTYSNSNWQTPLAVEFTNLDTSGNGLLLPNEASKGKAFNKQTFAKADVDHDGYIDQNEYVYHKTGKWPEAAQPVAASAAVNNVAVSEEPEIMAEAQTTANNEAPDETNKRTFGVVVDDSVITTKAKAKILATKDLKTLQISVETRQGEVTLSGSVDSEAAKMKAEQVVSEIEGVKSVKNALEVKN